MSSENDSGILTYQTEDGLDVFKNRMENQRSSLERDFVQIRDLVDKKLKTKKQKNGGDGV